MLANLGTVVIKSKVQYGSVAASVQLRQHLWFLPTVALLKDFVEFCQIRIGFTDNATDTPPRDGK